MDLVDTDVLIDIQRGHPPAVAWFAALTELPAVPGYVVMELIQDARDGREVRQSLKLVSPMTIVWPTEEASNRMLTDFAVRHLSDGVGILDALIAACAIGHSATLNTFNVKHYRAIPNLKTAQPYVR